MSLRTSAHTGAAIRFPAEMPGKLVGLRANSQCFSYSPKVLLFVMCCRKEYGLPRRFAPRNDMQKHGRCQRVQGRITCRSLPPVRTIPGHCRCTAGKRPYNRRRVAVFSMSLRTSAHTGVAIRVPAEIPGKLTAVRANSQCFSYSPKVLLLVLPHCKEYGLPRRFAPRNDMQKVGRCARVQGRNDMQKLAGCLRLPGGAARVLPGNALATADMG